MKGKIKILLCFLIVYPVLLQAQPKDVAQTNWRTEIPKVIYPDAKMVDLYEKTWEIAADRVRTGPVGLPATPYLDENCSEDQIWIWDTCFMVMFSKYAPNAYPGKQSLDNFYIPIHDKVRTPIQIHLRDNPPLFAWIEYNNYTFIGDKKHVQEVFGEKKYLQRHFNYFNTVQKGNMDRVMSPNPIFRDIVKDSKDSIIGYTWTGGASGMDNTPRGREAGGYDKIMWIDAIAQQALSALYISRLAETYGDKTESKIWSKRYSELKQIINSRYWDEEDGFYYDIEISTGKPCKIKTPASFWTMLAEIPNKKQAARMVKYLQSEEYLGGKYPWVSLAREDKEYNHTTGDYWKGGIWLPMVYMGTKALERYGYYELADELAERVIQQQLRTFYSVTPHTIWECYSPSADAPSTEYGRRARPDFCGWSALGPISLFIENVLGFRDANALTKTVNWSLKKKNGTHGIQNLKFGEIVTDIIYNDKTNEIYVKANHPYKLMVNGKKTLIKMGDNTISANSFIKN